MRTYNKRIADSILLNTDYNSPFSELKNIYMYAIAAIITGTPTGTLKLQASADPETNTTIPLISPSNWVDIADSDFTVTTAGNTMWNVRDVEIQGALSFTGELTIGSLNSFAGYELLNGAGAPQSIDMLITQPTVDDNATLTGADLLAVNTAMLLSVGDNSSVSTAFLGVTALGLPAVAALGTNSTVDHVGGAAFALSLDSSAGAGSSIGTVDLCRSLAIPNGITAVDKLRGYKFDLPFGDPGTQTWGVYMEPVCHNYMAGDLLVGGTPNSIDTPTNPSVGIELNSTVKAFLPSRMTETERDALTAVNGMVLYNLTTDKLQVYAAGVWVNLH